MSLHAKADINKLNDLVLEKEQEWRGLVQQHVESLVKELAEKDESIGLERLRFKKLKEDFEYNLKLLEERDKDLHKYEQLFEQFKANDNLNREQVSEMKIKIDDFQTKLIILQKEKEEVQYHYQMRLKKYEEEMRKFYSKKEEEHEKEKNEYEDLKRKLQMQIRDTEDEISFEKQKLLNQLEETLKQKEREYQVKLDQNQTDIHKYQLKIRMLSRELQLVQLSNAQVSENLENNKSSVAQWEKLAKEKEWELEDTKNMKDTQIKELEIELEELKKNLMRNKEDFQRKYYEVEKLSNERERSVTNLRTAADESERKLCEELKVLQQKNEQMELNFKRLQWEMVDYKAGKERETQMYIDKVAMFERKIKEETDSMNKLTVAKDLEVESLRSSEDWLKQEMDRLKNNVERLKKDLLLALERERIMENAKAQLELDWRRRYENKAAEVYEQRDGVIENLTKEKDEAHIALKKMERKVSQQENLIKLLQDDKEVAIKCLRKHGINTDSIFGDAIPEREGEALAMEGDYTTLQQQNIQLKEVVKEMRAEMEILSQQITSRTSTPNKNEKGNQNYVKDLEGEMQELKAANRQMHFKIEDLSKDGKPPLQPTGKINLNMVDPSIKGYIKELNETIGCLRNEKAQTKASLNSKDAAIEHFNEMISKLTNDKQQLVVLIDNLKYDMSSKTKVFEANICSLKDRISELELHLQQSRGEAEIYYKTVMERNLDAAQVGNRLTDLKLQQPAIGYVPPIHDRIDGTKTVSLYKEKLKLAVERIKELSKERSQLINVGNKLRADLLKLTGSLTANESSDEILKSKAVNLRHYSNNIQSQLDKLEQLQYQATAKELKGNIQDRKIVVDVNLTSTDTSELIEQRDSKDSNGRELIPSPMTASSEHSSIREIWKLLENAEESLQDTVEEKKQSPDDANDFSLVGKRMDPNKKNIPSKALVTKPKKVIQGRSKPKIRNYNVKNDV